MATNTNQKITAHNGYDLVSKKILIGRISISMLETQIEYTNNSIKIQHISNDIAEKKLKLTTALNSIFEKQLNDFTEARQNQCMELYKEINLLDEPVEEHKELIKKIRKLENHLTELQKQINFLEATIPKERVIVQYTANQTNPANQTTQANQANHTNPATSTTQANQANQANYTNPNKSD
jgi:hypothetical protein